MSIEVDDSFHALLVLGADHCPHTNFFTFRFVFPQTGRGSHRGERERVSIHTSITTAFRNLISLPDSAVHRRRRRWRRWASLLEVEVGVRFSFCPSEKGGHVILNGL